MAVVVLILIPLDFENKILPIHVTVTIPISHTTTKNNHDALIIREWKSACEQSHASRNGVRHDTSKMRKQQLLPTVPSTIIFLTSGLYFIYELHPPRNIAPRKNNNRVRRMKAALPYEFM